MELAGPHIAIADSGDTRDELLAAVTNAMRALTETEFGAVIRVLLSQIARLRLMFGGELDAAFAERIADSVFRAFATPGAQVSPAP